MYKRQPPRLVALQHRQAGPVFAAAARFRQDLQQGIDITIAKVNPLPRQWMNGVRRIAHQRQAGLNILQRMTPGKREGAGRLRRHLLQPRRKVTGDLLLELRLSLIHI